MSLQDFFYIVAIITMSIHVLILIIVIFVLLSIRKKITETADAIERKMENVKDLVAHPKIVATSIGKMILGGAVTQLTKLLRR
jgi:hypothetical protein